MTGDKPGKTILTCVPALQYPNSGPIARIVCPKYAAGVRRIGAPEHAGVAEA